jgi:hypothetical protein
VNEQRVLVAEVGHYHPGSWVEDLAGATRQPGVAEECQVGAWITAEGQRAQRLQSSTVLPSWVVIRAGPHWDVSIDRLVNK